MSFDFNAFILIVVMSISVIGLRLLPFLFFRKRETPDLIAYLGKYLPYAIMGMMVIYCLKDTKVCEKYYGIPELIAIVVTVSIQVWKKNSLVAIVFGTAVYMSLVNFITV